MYDIQLLIYIKSILKIHELCIFILMAENKHSTYFQLEKIQNQNFQLFIRFNLSSFLKQKNMYQFIFNSFYVISFILQLKKQEKYFSINKNQIFSIDQQEYRSQRKLLKK
ncbi:transmembrane protein, putative (macronuclear) [Tetrahymena thermophila SB210]|uniref:Transmembrane protein, putative n=1 Tax=Tetrahymena thermophila (strain SB210) TaxID=312017 RepID=W7XIF7_TETTS|nr:transmembrane protein, putative [Tetrahymena thermophila SB210]EWS73249.1 transmembrane protein, putative [Tetrahymena thermophila SB210]|eukprot:XP_012654213.1 transmembrane protein, putative [Tetrahymena thermophila SB210]